MGVRHLIPGEPDDAEFVIEVSNEEGSAEAGELAVLRHWFGHAKPDELVIFDAGDALEYETADEVQNRDFPFEARDALRRRLHMTGALLDFVIKTKPEAIPFLKDKVARMSEDRFIESVMLPILKAEGYETAKPGIHGPTHADRGHSCARSALRNPGMDWAPTKASGSTRAAGDLQA